MIYDIPDHFQLMLHPPLVKHYIHSCICCRAWQFYTIPRIFIVHMRRVWHADRDSLLLWTRGLSLHIFDLLNAVISKFVFWTTNFGNPSVPVFNMSPYDCDWFKYFKSKSFLGWFKLSWCIIGSFCKHGIFSLERSIHDSFHVSIITIVIITDILAKCAVSPWQTYCISTPENISNLLWICQWTWLLVLHKVANQSHAMPVCVVRNMSFIYTPYFCYARCTDYVRSIIPWRNCRLVFYGARQIAVFWIFARRVMCVASSALSVQAENKRR